MSLQNERNVLIAEILGLMTESNGVWFHKISSQISYLILKHEGDEEATLAALKDLRKEMDG